MFSLASLSKHLFEAAAHGLANACRDDSKLWYSGCAMGPAANFEFLNKVVVSKFERIVTPLAEVVCFTPRTGAAQ